MQVLSAAFLLATGLVAQQTIEVSITTHTTPEELTELQEQLAEHEIELIVNDSEFICDRLTYIDFTIVYQNSERVGYETKRFTEDHTITITATPRKDGSYGFRVGGSS